MPINFKLDDDANCSHDIVRRWEINGHEVAVILHGRIDLPEMRKMETLVCECDYDVVDTDDGSVRRLRSPDACEAKKLARNELKSETAVLLRVELSLKGLEEAILCAFTKVEAGTCLGQFLPGIIYVQEVAELLGKTTGEVYAAVRKLFAAGKLNLYGMILTAYVQRFRFPEEIQYMIRLMVESPLGWPNGDAGGGVIAALEQAIDTATDYKHGKDAFWEHNYPNIAPHHLLDFGMHFIDLAIARGETDETAWNDLRFTDCEQVARWLETMAARFRAFGAAKGFPESPVGEALQLIEQVEAQEAAGEETAPDADSGEEEEAPEKK